MTNVSPPAAAPRKPLITPEIIAITLYRHGQLTLVLDLILKVVRHISCEITSHPSNLDCVDEVKHGCVKAFDANI